MKYKNMPFHLSPVIGRKLAASLLTLGLGAGVLSRGADASAARACSTKYDRFLERQAQSPSASGWTSVIAKISGPLTPRQEKQLHGYVYRHLPLIDSVALRIPLKRLGELAALPFVRHLSADVSVSKTDAFTVSSSVADLAAQQYSTSSFTLNGAGVTVAVVDSGIRTLSDFADPKTGALRIKAKVNFADTITSNGDTCGHGSHVAGIVAGNGSLSNRQVMGIAAGANLADVRVLNKQGQGTVSNVISGVQWAINNRAALNIRVLNMSVGHPVGESYTTDPLCQIVEQAWKAGIVVVVAAGNNGRLNAAAAYGMANEGYGVNYGSIQCPGNDPYVITVGAMKSMTGSRADDRIATYSSRGPTRLDLVMKPDIVAPGNKVVSDNSIGSYLYNYYSGNCVPETAGTYYMLSGTSMAAPVVSGAAALLLQKYPTLSPDTVKARLMLSADKWSDPSGNSDPCTYGAGYLNILAALQSKAVPTQSAMSPSMTTDGSGNVYVTMDRAIWGVSSVDGSRALWGVSGINDLRAVWGTRAIWGTSDNQLSASRAIWGTSVWSDRAIWGVSTQNADLSSTVIYGE